MDISLNLLPFVLVLFTTSCLIFSATSFEVAGSPGNWESCEKLVSNECGQQVHSYVFNDEEGVVSLQCCVELVELGKDCHEAFLVAYLKDPIYTHNSTEILRRNSKIWNQCVSVVKGEAPPERCERMHNEECGEQIVHKIFHNIGEVNDTCCGYLIYWEKECHDSAVWAVIASGGFESNKTQVLEGSTEVWNRRASIAQTLPAVKSCQSKMTATCGIQVGDKILLNKGIITKECCIQLLKNGRECHDLLTLTDIALPQYQAHSKDMLERSAIAWNKCLEQLA